MLRTAMATYLMLVTLAGPSLCCCRTGCAVAVPALPRQNVPEGRPATCPNCSGEHRPASPSNDSRVPETPACPCEKHCSDSSPALLTERDDGMSVDSRNPIFGRMTLQALLPAILSDIADLGISYAGRDSLFPCLSPRDRLRALHVMRC